MDGGKAYLDASVVLRRLLHQPDAISDWSMWQLLVSSELMRVEVLRTLDRLHVLGQLSDERLAAHLEELNASVVGFEEVPWNAAFCVAPQVLFPLPSVLSMPSTLPLPFCGLRPTTRN